jgi:DNA repair protein RecN (Recombination protein N)
MLTELAIRNLILIEAADLELGAGLSVLTGETGAGKSIMLGGLELALGGRAERGFIRAGAEAASVTATFEVAADHPAFAALLEAGLPAIEGEPIILRRTISGAGQSRAFINDAPVSVQLLRAIGDSLVEIHGQHEERGLLDPAGHRALLDSFADLGALRTAMEAAYMAWRAVAEEAEAHGAAQAALEAEADYLTHAAQELAELTPEPGEEGRLADERALRANAARIAADVEEAQTALGENFEARLGQALRRLERADTAAQSLLAPAAAALERAVIEAREAGAQLHSALDALRHDPQRLTAIEERLFALRAAARKFRVTPDALAHKRAEIEASLAALESHEHDALARAKCVAEAKAKAVALARDLSQSRAAASAKLDAAVNRELAPLKLGKAVFSTRIEPLAGDGPGAAGGDRVIFEVATNPGAPAGPLKAIASGGELVRFILALKVVLARGGSAASLVFDEVDRGIGGAVADAVGERLARLAGTAQVLVVTHSPQVAARANHHFLVTKTAGRKGARAAIEALSEAARAEEIARMLSGAEVTQEARAAARRLIDAATPAANETPRARRKPAAAH